MRQKLDKLSTNIKRLDDDLQELFAICENKEKVNTIKQAFDNKDISSEDFSKIVPMSLITLSFFFAGPQFEILLEKVDRGAIGLLQEAKSLIEKHFGNVFENQNAKSMLESVMTKKEERPDIESLADEKIQGIEYYLAWEDDPPELAPAVRIAFKNRKKKILLNTRLDWEDFSFVLKSLSGIFVELLEKGKPLAELGQINLSDSEKVVKYIEETLANLQKTKEIMPIYKAKSQPDSNKQPVEDSSN